MASVLLFHLNVGKTHVAVDFIHLAGVQAHVVISFIHLKTDQLMLSPLRTDLVID